MQQSTAAPPRSSIEERYQTFFHAVLFVLGLSLVFVVGWGGAATIFGRVFGEYKVLLARAGGVAVILFGLTTLGVIKWRWFYRDTRPQWQANPAHRSSSSLFIFHCHSRRAALFPLALRTAPGACLYRLSQRAGAGRGCGCKGIRRDVLAGP